MTQKELTCITVNAVTLKMLLVYPKFIAENSGNAAWITCAAVTLAAVAFAYISGELLRGGKCIVDLSKHGAARVLAGAILIAVLVLNMLATILFLPVSVKTVMLQYTNIYVIAIALAVTVTAVSFAGLHAAARIHAIFVPIAAGILAFFLILLTSEMNVRHLTPLFGTGYKNVFLNGLYFISLYTDLVLLNVIGSECRDKQKARRAVITGILISGGTCALFLAAYAAVFPRPVMEYTLMPMYSLSKSIKFGAYFGRFEALIEFIVVLLGVLYAGVYMNAIASVVERTFYVKGRNLILCIEGILLLAALILSGTVATLERMVKVFYAAAVVLTAVLAAMYGVMRKAGGKDE